MKWEKLRNGLRRKSEIRSTSEADVGREDGIQDGIQEEKETSDDNDDQNLML